MRFRIQLRKIKFPGLKSLSNVSKKQINRHEENGFEVGLKRPKEIANALRSADSVFRLGRFSKNVQSREKKWSERKKLFGFD